MARFDQRKRTAQRRFADFVREGMKIGTSPRSELKGQTYLDDESFVESLQRETPGNRNKLQDILKGQKYENRPRLHEPFEGNARSNKRERNLAIDKAHVERGYRLQKSADHLSMHYVSINSIVVQVER